MHDTILLGKISQALGELCKENHIVKIDQLIAAVSEKSHVNQENLFEFLKEQHPQLVGDWTEIVVTKEDIEDQSAILHSIKGEILVR